MPQRHNLILLSREISAIRVIRDSDNFARPDAPASGGYAGRSASTLNQVIVSFRTPGSFFLRIELGVLFLGNRDTEKV